MEMEMPRMQLHRARVLTPVGWLVAGAQEEWRRGLTALHADSVDKLKKCLPKLEAEVQQVHVFRDFYKYAFQFCCTGKFAPRASQQPLNVLVVKIRSQIDGGFL
jgi:hypothetical protein